MEAEAEAANNLSHLGQPAGKRRGALHEREGGDETENPGFQVSDQNNQNYSTMKQQQASGIGN